MILYVIVVWKQNEAWSTTTKITSSHHSSWRACHFDVAGPFRTASIHRNKYGLIFIDHFTNTPFNYAMKSKDEFPKFLQQFLIDFKELFKGWKVIEIQVLRSDNASEFNSAEVQQIYRDKGIKRQFSSPGQQFQNGKGENVSVTYG